MKEMIETVESARDQHLETKAILTCTHVHLREHISLKLFC